MTDDRGNWLHIDSEVLNSGQLAFSEKLEKPTVFGRKKVVPQQPQSEPPQTCELDPIADAARYVGCVSAPGEPIFVEGLSKPTACFGGNQEAGLCFLFNSSVSASGRAYFFGSFASIWVDGEPAPRVPIPTAMIANRVAHYEVALRVLLGASLGGAMVAGVTGIG